MKKTSRLLLPLVLCSLLLTAYTCEREEEEIIRYPIETEISTYALGTTCNWQNLEADSLYVIQSTEELQAYITCESVTPAIDFEENTLLVIRGVTPQGIQDIVSMLKQTSLKEYLFEVDITMDMTAMPGGWVVAVLTPKIEEDANIRVAFKLHH